MNISRREVLAGFGSMAALKATSEVSCDGLGFVAEIADTTRREAARAFAGISDTHSAVQAEQTTPAFSAKQAERRKELWSLLGDLPTAHVPGPPKVVSTEKH